MKSLVTLKLIALTVLLAVAANVTYAQTYALTPTQVPKGAYVNGGDGDHQFIQQIVYTVGTTWGAASVGVDMTITLPDSMTIADTDEDGAYTDEVTLIEATTATTVTLVATSTTITIDASVLIPVAAETMTIIFPVNTSAYAATGNQTYAVVYTSDADPEETGGTITVAFADTLTLMTWDPDYEGNDDQSSTLGDVYPAALSVLFTGGIDLLTDAALGQGVAGNAWHGGALDATNDNGEVTTTIWASQTSGLTRVNNQSGHRPLNTVGPQLLTDNDGAETVGTAGGAPASYQLDGELLAEGNWWFYLTTSATGDWVLASSDTVEFRHWPAFNTTNVEDGGGFDFGAGNVTTDAADGIYNPVAPSGGDDVASLTLESGGTLGKAGGLVVTATNQTMSSTTFFWDYSDVDDTASLDIFLSTDDALTTTNLVLTGAQGSEVVDSIGWNSRKITATSIPEEGSTGTFSYSIYTNPTTYEPANTYYIYYVANDGKNQAVYQLATNGAADKQVTIAHYPYFKFDDVYNNLATANVDPTTLNTNADDYYVISWNATPASGLGDGDQDADGNATITFYYTSTYTSGGFFGLEAINNASGLAVTDATLLADAAWIAATTLIDSVYENTDTKAGNRYMWDIASAGLTDGNDHFIIAHIREGSDHLFVQYTSALGPVAGGAPILEDREVVPTHSAYFRAETPLAGETITLGGDDEFQFKWTAYDKDDATTNYTSIVIVPQGATMYATYTLLLAEAGNASVDNWYWITTLADGSASIGASAGPSPESGVFTLDVSDITDNMGAAAAAVPSGFYDVYYTISYDGTLNGEAPVQAPGVLRFTGSTATATNFYLTPNKATLSKGDTITVDVKAQSSSALAVRILSFSLDLPTTYLTVIEQSSNTPFINENLNYVGSAVLENSLDSSGGVWSLDFVETQATPVTTLAAAGLTVAQFQLVVTASGSGPDFISNQATFINTASRITGIVDANGNSETLTIASPAGDFVLAPPGGLDGEVELEVKSESGQTVDISVTPRGSYTPISDADYLAANGGANSDGSVTVTLGAGGSYSLSLIPTGDYDVLVHKEYHLDQLAEGVTIRPVNTTTQDFVGADMLLTGDIAGWDDDTDASTASVPDNQVGSADITAVSDAFGTTPDSSAWNAAADFNNDSLIYIQDYNVVTTNSGTNGEGLLFKAVPTGANTSVIAKLVAVRETNEEVTYEVNLENLSSLHAYAVELDYNSADWELVSFSDGMADYYRAAGFSKPKAFGATFASGLIGRDLIRSSEMTLMTVTMRSKTRNPQEISLSEVSLVDGSGSLSKAVLNELAAGLPAEYTLSQNYPNPFNPTTSINFSLPNAGYAKLVVYNLLGQQVHTLVSSALEAGTYKAAWNSRDINGRKVSTGLYIYRLEVDGKVIATRKMVLLK